MTIKDMDTGKLEKMLSVFRIKKGFCPAQETQNNTTICTAASMNKYKGFQCRYISNSLYIPTNKKIYFCDYVTQKPLDV